MYFKIGEIRPFAINIEGNHADIIKGKVIKVDEVNKQYTMEFLETKEQYIVSQDHVFIGDD